METRDKNIVNFINMVELCNRDQIKNIYFKNVHQNICMRRLKKLSDDEYINRLKYNGNSYIYYSDKKPSKRMINHDLYITDFVVKMIKNNYKILEFKKSFVIGNIISDAYIRYQTPDGIKRHCLLEIQLSNKVDDCVLKYKNFKNTIINSDIRWDTIPRIIIITDMPQRIHVKGINVLYDDTNINNIINLI